MATKTNTKKIIKDGILTENPIIYQVIGICSALAVTNLMLNSLIMGVALTFVTALSSFTISILRNHTPAHIRIYASNVYGARTICWSDYNKLYNYG